ncbi:uncharacterized protein EDB91DRAFT_1120356 [Suillus paluster]|uniref:uncharacterized protein n=1 Tax=Suillus paluster TaxID=48578 RepID=UPI001B87E519|nr:uncharacterized protein EDB91DRAFT_1120356 [Suillus paluster]KAG1746041.1 hypothetical protein EDB91DRAFT_1120356 [Suillus paluster]
MAGEQTLPVSLRNTSTFTRVLCCFALGRPDLEDHWESLQSADSFEIMRGRMYSILTVNVTAAGLLLATSGVFVTTSSPVPDFDYTMSGSYFPLFMSLMLAMIAMLTSGLSMIRWQRAERQRTREQFESGGYFLLSYLLSIVMPMFFVVASLNCFVVAMAIAGFYSQNMVCRTLTALWLVMYVVSIGMILMGLVWKYVNNSSGADLDSHPFSPY